MLAIYSSIKYIRNSKWSHNYVIFTDSLSSVKCLNSHRNNNSLKSNIIEAINDLPNEITIFWIPGHSNIEGNERVDCLAKEAANSANLEISEKYCTYEDTLRCINTAIEEKWLLKWRRKETKLKEIKRTTDRWKNKSNLNKKEEVILTRLRIGHTRYTHGYLMSS